MDEDFEILRRGSFSSSGSFGAYDFFRERNIYNPNSQNIYRDFGLREIIYPKKPDNMFINKYGTKFSEYDTVIVVDREIKRNEYCRFKVGKQFKIREFKHVENILDEKGNPINLVISNEDSFNLYQLDDLDLVKSETEEEREERILKQKRSKKHKKTLNRIRDKEDLRCSGRDENLVDKLYLEHPDKDERGRKHNPPEDIINEDDFVIDDL